MNMRELYEHMKDAANYLGPGFGGMDEINVKLIHDSASKASEIRFSFSGKYCALHFSDGE